jgi:hypothetical protein
MNPQLIDYFLAEQANRTRLDQQALQTWTAHMLLAGRDGQPNSRNVARLFGRWSARLVPQVIGAISESAHAAEEAIVPHR